MTPPEIYSSLQVMKETTSHWWFLCPFHDDRKPSMTVEKTGQYAGNFKCWACGETGTLKTFAKKMGIKATSVKNVVKRIKNKMMLSSEKLAEIHVKFMLHGNKLVFHKLANKLGVSEEILRRLHVGFDGRAFSFPMFGGQNELIGIRLRTLEGAKYSCRGGRNGLFVPLWQFKPKHPLLITEGESDCAAALQMGFQAIGIPGKSQCKAMLAEWLQSNCFASVVIVADNDKAGQQGAKGLAKYLAFKHAIDAKIINPPKEYKDFRQWFINHAKVCEVIDRINTASYQIGSEVAIIQNKLRIQVKGNK